MNPVASRFLVVALLALGGCGPVALEGMALLGDIDAGFGPSRLKDQTPAPIRAPLDYRVDGRARHGDLYLSPEGARGGLVLVPGVAEAGKDDPRLVALANSLARVRFAVLVPDITGLKKLRVRPADAVEIADAMRWLGARADLAPDGRLGAVAISYAVGPTLLAALDPAVGDSLRFLVALGGYYDMTALVTFFTTGYFRERGALRYMSPNAYGKWVFARSNLVHVANDRDRALLDEMATRKMADLEADIADLARELGAEGRAIHDLLTNTEPDRVAGLIERLSPAMRADMTALDPSARDLSGLKARLILIHGRADAIVPYTESQALAAAAPAGQAALYLVEGLFHVDADLGWRDQFILLYAAIDLLEQRAPARDR